MSTQRPAPRNARNAQVSITQEQEAWFRLVKAIERDPGCSQRSLAREAGASLGRVNSVRDLIRRGLLRIDHYLPRSSNRARKGPYVVTHRRLAYQLRLTQAYLALKRRGFHELKIEIETMERPGRSGPKLANRAS